MLLSRFSLHFSFQQFDYGVSRCRSLCVHLILGSLGLSDPQIHGFLIKFERFSATFCSNIFFCSFLSFPSESLMTHLWGTFGIIRKISEPVHFSSIFFLFDLHSLWFLLICIQVNQFFSFFLTSQTCC